MSQSCASLLKFLLNRCSEVSVGPVLRRAPPRETQERPRHDATRREHLEQLLQVTTKILYANTTEDKRVSGKSINYESYKN